MISLGIQQGTSALIGNCIGANNVPLAKRFYHLIAKITTLVVIMLSLLTLIERPIILYLTSSEKVQERANVLFIIVAVMKLYDSFKCFMQGAICAMGLQKDVYYWVIACNWIIGVPLGSRLGNLQGIGVTGLFTGICTGFFLQTMAYFLILVKQDWQQVADNTAKRIENEQKRLG